MTAFEVAMSRKSSIKKPPHLFDLDSSSSYSLTALSSSSLSSSLSSSSLSSSASSSASPPSSTPSSWRVRSNYLQRIGIVRTTSPIIVIKNSSTLLSPPERTTRDLCNVPRFNAPLRYEKDGDDDDGDVHLRNRLISEGSQDRKRVNFREDVTVVPIPMRSEYSDRIKTKLWTGRVELCEIVERNLEEFAAENYNWRSVCPEEHMLLCTDTQELIHPVHLELGRYTFGTGGRVARNLHCSL